MYYYYSYMSVSSWHLMSHVLYNNAICSVLSPPDRNPNSIYLSSAETAAADWNLWNTEQYCSSNERSDNTDNPHHPWCWWNAQKLQKSIALCCLWRLSIQKKAQYSHWQLALAELTSDKYQRSLTADTKRMISVVIRFHQHLDIVHLSLHTWASATAALWPPAIITGITSSITEKLPSFRRSDHK